MTARRDSRGRPGRGADVDELREASRALAYADRVVSRELLSSVQGVLDYSAALVKRSVPEDAATDEDWGRRVFEHVMRNPDGMTFRDEPGDGPDSGFVVSRPRDEKHEERVPFYMLTPGDFNDYGGRKRDVINGDPANNFGGWRSLRRDEDDDPEQYPPEERYPRYTPLYYFDVSESEHDPWDAATKALRGKQDAVFDLNEFKEYPTDEMMVQTHWQGDPEQPGWIFSRRRT